MRYNHKVCHCKHRNTYGIEIEKLELLRNLFKSITNEHIEVDVNINKGIKPVTMKMNLQHPAYTEYRYTQHTLTKLFFPKNYFVDFIREEK